MKPYQDLGAVDCTTDFDSRNLAGKSVIVTGGANGIGEAYVRAFAGAGAFVTIGDLEEDSGARLVSELGENAQFVRCDVTKWTDQLATFKKAILASPSKRVDIVVANAGISGPDPVFISDEPDEPKEPNLKILDVDINGVMYTTKLALHYFKKQYEHSSGDTCLILQSSLAAYLDFPGIPQYQAAKFAVRGIMHCFRQTTWQHGTRVNCIAPWFVRTRILDSQFDKLLTVNETKVATVQDAAAAAIRIASDPAVNGRSIGIVPHEWASKGYLDVDRDDYKHDDPLKEWGEALFRAVTPAEVGLSDA